MTVLDEAKSLSVSHPVPVKLVSFLDSRSSDVSSVFDTNRLYTEFASSVDPSISFAKFVEYRLLWSLTRFIDSYEREISDLRSRIDECVLDDKKRELQSLLDRRVRSANSELDRLMQRVGRIVDRETPKKTETTIHRSMSPSEMRDYIIGDIVDVTPDD